MNNFLSVFQSVTVEFTRPMKTIKVSIHRGDELVEPAEKDVVIGVSCVLLF